MGITVEMFCKTYKANSKAKDKTFEDFIKKHITKEYISFLEKEVMCTSIIEATCHTQSGDRKIFKINSTGRYLLFIMRLIDLYTDIEIDFTDGKFVEQYDELNKIGAINVLVNAIPENEYAEFNTILNMKMDDIRDNEYSITAFIYNLKESLSISEEVINSALESIIEKETLDNE
jgi:hypothetical protein